MSNSPVTGPTTYVDDYLADLGPDDADITSHDVYTRGVPHATFERLRREDPVHWTEEADGSGFWSILRYDDALAISRDVETFTSSKGIRLEEMDEDEAAARLTMMELDPPDHTQYRRLVSKGFTGRSVNGYEDDIRQLAVEVIDQALEEPEFDFVHAIAQQLPMRMLGKMLGTSDEDGHKLVEWGDALLGNTDPEFTDYPVDLTDTEQFRMVPFRSPASIQIFQFAQEQVLDRRTCPRDDVISQLLAPTKSGEPLTDHQFNNFFTLLVAAGNDTTRYTMTHGLWTMMNHPQLWETWKNDPSLTPTAIEEIMRTSAVTMHFRRTATRDVELRGRQIKAGDKVVLWFNSANHDAEQFEHPFRFDLARDPNDHMTFGRGGPHFCLGAWLARMEVRLVFEELFKRIDHFEPAGDLDRLRSNFIAGIKRLPVRHV
ncbi:MAG: cytochrome P450 [Ilumatobacter sp.]|uniref:cytochrome P450 n=1 Tax=Ilumatobacter sp. TaxID=1967498 RepID=UPI003C764C11